MIDYARFLSDITGDDTWQGIELTFVNANQRKAKLAIDADSITLAIDGKTIYCGPTAAERQWSREDLAI